MAEEVNEHELDRLVAIYKQASDSTGYSLTQKHAKIRAGLTAVLADLDQHPLKRIGW